MGKKLKRNSLVHNKDEKHFAKESHPRLTKKYSVPVEVIPVSNSDQNSSGKDTTDSAVAISISSVSHHRKIKKATPASSLEILFADDNQVNYLVVKRILENQNVNIYHAINGLEAVKMVMSIPHIDLIIMDIKMPVMNGLDAIKKLREISPEIPIIAQSAFTDEIDILSLFQAGCDDFITKPIDPSLLLSKITCWNF